MERLLKAQLRTATLRPFGSPGAGCISEGRSYDTDAGPVFVKVNHRAQVRAEGHPGRRAPAGALGAADARAACGVGPAARSFFSAFFYPSGMGVGRLGP